MCSTCRTWSDAGATTCSNCQEVYDALGAPALPLNVVTLYRKPSLLRDWLTGYKGDMAGATPSDPACLPPVRALVGRFLLEHGDTIAQRAGGIDGLVVVPSTDRPPPHPLSAVLDSLRLTTPPLPALIRGAGQLGFRRPDRHGFEATDRVQPGLRLLVIDDVYTTGARSNSAAAALREAGAHVAGVLVFARRVNPEWNAEALTFWSRQTAKPFDWAKSPVLAAPR